MRDGGVHDGSFRDGGLHHGSLRHRGGGHAGRADRRAGGHGRDGNRTLGGRPGLLDDESQGGRLGDFGDAVLVARLVPDGRGLAIMLAVILAIGGQGRAAAVEPHQPVEDVDGAGRQRAQERDVHGRRDHEG